MISPKHPCQDKCSNFTEEQCCHCLIQEHAEPTNDEQKYFEAAQIALNEVP